MTSAGINWQIGLAAWIAPIFLLFYTRRSKVKGFILLFIFLFFAGALQTNTNKFDIFAMYIINGLIFAVAFTLIYFTDRLLYKKSERFYTTLIFPSILTVFEFLFTSVLRTLGMIAHTQYHFATFIQMSSVTGIFGITFMIVWFASIINWLFENNFITNYIFKGSIIYGGIFIAFLFQGMINLSYSYNGLETVKVATISCDTDIHKLFINEQDLFSDYLKIRQPKFHPEFMPVKMKLTK